MSAPVYRFAPSPNGYLHLGHAFSALVNFELARAAGGRLILRIEDIDAARCRPEYEQAIYQDLAWLGIAWEEPVRRQSEHFEDYRAARAPLDAGTAKMLPRSERMRRVEAGEPYALRLDMAAAIERVGALDWAEGGRGPGGESGIVAAAPAAWGDVVLARKDMPT